MRDQELAEALIAIPPLIGDEPLRVSQVVANLSLHNIGEEAVRLAIWYLVDQGEIEFTPDWRVHLRHTEVGARSI